MSLNKNALIDLEYYYVLASDEVEGDLAERNYLEAVINAVSTQFEIFCNRFLKERIFTHDDSDTTNYNVNLLHYCLFDAPKLGTFWFPTYPVKTLAEFEISGTVLSEAAADDLDASDGYILYSRKGKLVYAQGFDYPYLQNVKIKWTGGYNSTHSELADLQYLCYMAVKNYLNAPENSMMESERMGNYTYKLMSPHFLMQLRGYSPEIFENLMKYRKVAFA